MKSKKYLIVLGFLLLGITTFAQDTIISWRMGNPRIVRITGTDNWIEFDVQIKSNVTGMFLSSIDFRITRNNTAFPAGAGNIVTNKLNQYAADNINGPGNPKYNQSSATLTGTGTATNPYRAAFGMVPNGSSGQLGGPDYYAEISTDWHSVQSCRIKYAAGATAYNLQAVMDWIIVTGAIRTQLAYKPLGKLLARPGTQTGDPDNSYLFEAKDFGDLYLGRIHSNSHGWTSVGVNGTSVKNKWNYTFNTTVWDGTGHVDTSHAVCGNCIIKYRWDLDGVLSSNGKVIIDPNASLTASGSTRIESNNGLVIASTAAGTGAFIDNGTITYLENGINESWMSIYRWITDPVVGLYQHLVTAPMQGITLQFFEMVNHLTYAYEYNEAANGWNNIWVPNTPTPAMKGLTLSVAKQSGDGSIGFPYKPYTGNTTINLTKSDFSGVPADDNWNLVGNPFASPIDWEIDAGWTRDNVGPTIYIWNPAVGNYGSYNRNTNIGNNGVTQFIPVGQGFFVQATTNNYTFGVNNNARVISTQPFLKDSPANTLRLKASGNFSSDEAVISFMDGATTEYEMDFDAPKKMSTSQDVHSADPVSTSFFLKSSDNVPLSVYVREPSSQQVTVPAGFRFGAEGQYTITASEIETFSAATTIFIEDLKDNVWQNLKENAVYTFNAVNGDNQDRFLIHFYGPTSVNELSSQSISIYSYGKYAYIMNPSEENIQRVEVYDMQGNMVMTTKVTKTTLTKFAINNPSAYYLVKVITDRGITSEKIYIGVM